MVYKYNVTKIHYQKQGKISQNKKYIRKFVNVENSWAGDCQENQIDFGKRSFVN